MEDPIRIQEEPLPTYTDSPRLHQHPSAATSPDGRTPGIDNAMARFEYEAEKTSVSDATKVLLIEWEEERAHTQTQGPGEWTVEWIGKGTKREGITLKSPQPSTTKPEETHRLYFLLQPGAPVPPTISISFAPLGATMPTIAAAVPTLPAIFPPSLLTSGTSLGKKGVLHTLWAKSRLAALRAEIDEEESAGRFEGIGVEMARDELEWIKEHFGVSEKSHSGANDVPASPRHQYHELDGESDLRGRRPSAREQLSPLLRSPTVPHSPGAGTQSERLQQKMKGLRVGTSPSSSTASPTPPTSATSATAKAPMSQAPAGILTPPQTGSSNMASKNPLSPEVGDVAVGSRSLFAALKGPHPSENQQQPSLNAVVTGAKRPMAVAPPSQSGGPGFGGIGSLNTMVDTQTGFVDKGGLEEEEREEGLFALPMSPR